MNVTRTDRVVSKFILQAHLGPDEVSECRTVIGLRGLTIEELIALELDPLDYPTIYRLISTVEKIVPINILDVTIGAFRFESNVRLSKDILEVAISLKTILAKL